MSFSYKLMKVVSVCLDVDIDL